MSKHACLFLGQRLKLPLKKELFKNIKNIQKIDTKSGPSQINSMIGIDKGQSLIVIDAFCEDILNKIIFIIINVTF